MRQRIINVQAVTGGAVICAVADGKKRRKHKPGYHSMRRLARLLNNLVMADRCFILPVESPTVEYTARVGGKV